MYWCFFCYAVNDRPAGACARCGRPIEGPANLSRTDQMVWALHHPDGARAVMAARRIGSTGTSQAVPELRRIVESPDSDPYVAAESLRAVIPIEGAPQLRGWLDELQASGNTAVVRRIAEQARAKA